MGVADSKPLEEMPPQQVLQDTESSEEELENLEIINILKNAGHSPIDYDQDVSETTSNVSDVPAPKKDDSSNYYSEITKYSQSLWSFVAPSDGSQSTSTNGHAVKSKSEQLDNMLNESTDSFDIFGLSKSLTSQVESFVEGFNGRAVERPPSVSVIEQFLDGSGSTSSKQKLILPTSYTIEVLKEYLKEVQEETPVNITNIRLSESFSEGSGNLYELTELITGVNSDVLEPEIENLRVNHRKTVIWQSETALLIRFGTSKQDKIIVIDTEGAAAEEDYLSVCALFQEYRTKQCFELITDLSSDDVVVRSLRVWYEVVNLSLFVTLKEDLVDLYDEDLLYVLPVPVFEHYLLMQWDFIQQLTTNPTSGRIVRTGDMCTFFKSIYDHLSTHFDSDAVFIYLKDLLQFIQRSGVLNNSGEGQIFGNGIVVILRYLNHHVPEDKQKLLLRVDIPNGQKNNNVRCYYEEFIIHDESRPLLQSLGQICLKSDTQGPYCTYKYETVVQPVQDLIANSNKLNWKDVLSLSYQ